MPLESLASGRHAIDFRLLTLASVSPAPIVTPVTPNETEGAVVSVGGGTVTLTVAVLDTVPPAPLQLRVNVTLVVKSPVVWLPLSVLPPFQAAYPLPVQLVVLAVVQLKVLAFPITTEVGEAEKLTVGAGIGATVMIAESVSVPPAPLQVSVRVAVDVRFVRVWTPLVFLSPFQAVSPLALQLVAFVLLQVTELVPPLATEVGLAEIVTVGAEAAATVSVAVFDTVPPIPVQTSVSVPPAVKEFRDWLPLTVFVPFQPEYPLAVQLVAFALVHVAVVEPPYATDAGEILKLEVGAAGAATAIVTDLVVVPPGPVQASVKVASSSRALNG